jgi:transcriptional regulator with XRE-family HTH domain
MFPNLKMRLWTSGIRQNRLAQILMVHETLLSKVINGYREPKAELRRRIADILGADEQWLFARSHQPENKEPGEGLNQA